MNEEGFEKIHVDLPNHLTVGGESMWAESLGNDMYRLMNVPFYAYGLNFQDIVRATTDSDKLKPEIRQLVVASGHRTIRLSFSREIAKEEQERILDTFKELAVSYERCDSTFIALDVKPEGNYQSVFEKLEEYEKQSILEFETCEARTDGSFDDVYLRE